jgi:hypothetical protein
MRKFIFTVTRLFMALLLVSSLTGCSYWSALSEHLPFVPKKKAQEAFVKNLWSLGEQYVAIQKQDGQQGVVTKPNQRVSEISVERVRAMLESMNLHQTGRDKTISVFNEDEIKVLSEYIPVGLALAGPDEDVTFAVIGRYVESLGYLKKREVTTGRVFVQNGQLNIIFGDIHRELKETMGVPEDRRLNPFAPGSRSGSYGYLDGSVLPKEGGEPFNKIRQDWVVFQLNPSALASATQQEEYQGTYRPNAGTLSPAPDSMASGPAQPAPQQETAQPAPKYAAPQQQTAPAPQYTAPAPSYAAPQGQIYQQTPQYTPQYSGPANRSGYANAKPADKKSIEDRLVILNNLRGKRLITEQEYRDIRMQILGELQ